MEIVEGGFADVGRAFRLMLREVNEIQLFAEAFKNAVEAPGSTFMHIGPVKIPKLSGHGNMAGYKVCMTNDGLGLSYEELKRLAFLNDKHDAKHGKTEENFNSGLRITGLKASQKGFLFASCHKGDINVARIYLMDDGRPAAAMNEPHYLRFFRTFGWKEGDWVKVVFMGNSMGHPTFSMPFGKLTDERPWIPLFKSRFYKVKKPFDFVVETSRTEALGDSYDRLEKEGKLKRWRVKCKDGCTLIYHYFKEETKTVSCLLHNNGLFTEMFDVRHGDRNTAKMSAYYDGNENEVLGAMGAYHLRGHVSVMIEFSEDSGVFQNQRRSDLLDGETQKVIKINNYLWEIGSYMPEEFKAIIDKDKGEKKVPLASAMKKFRELMPRLGITLEGLKAVQKSDLIVNHCKIIPTPDDEDSGGGKKKKRKKRERELGGICDEPTPAEKTAGLPVVNCEYAMYDPDILGKMAGHYYYLNKNNPLVIESLKVLGRASRDTKGKDQYLTGRVAQYAIFGLGAAKMHKEENVDATAMVNSAVLASLFIAMTDGTLKADYTKYLKGAGNEKS